MRRVGPDWLSSDVAIDPCRLLSLRLRELDSTGPTALATTDTSKVDGWGRRGGRRDCEHLRHGVGVEGLRVGLHNVFVNP